MAAMVLVGFDTALAVPKGQPGFADGQRAKFRGIGLFYLVVCALALGVIMSVREGYNHEVSPVARATAPRPAEEPLPMKRKARRMLRPLTMNPYYLVLIQTKTLFVIATAVNTLLFTYFVDNVVQAEQ